MSRCALCHARPLVTFRPAAGKYMLLSIFNCSTSRKSGWIPGLAPSTDYPVQRQTLNYWRERNPRRTELPDRLLLKPADALALQHHQELN